MALVWLLLPYSSGGSSVDTDQRELLFKDATAYSYILLISFRRKTERKRISQQQQQQQLLPQAVL